LGATLNWRPVREIEREIEQIKQRSRQNESEAEQRMKQIEARTKQIESETEQLRRENARERALSALIKQHCFPPECSSNPPQPIEIDCGPSSP
jgi:predicted  nucleic acid-binding Zn-ribbon protein